MATTQKKPPAKAKGKNGGGGHEALAERIVGSLPKSDRDRVKVVPKGRSTNVEMKDGRTVMAVRKTDIRVFAPAATEPAEMTGALHEALVRAKESS